MIKSKSDLRYIFVRKTKINRKETCHDLTLANSISVVNERLTKNMPPTRAIIHIARKLLNRIRYVLKNQKEYVPAVIQ